MSIEKLDHRGLPEKYMVPPDDALDQLVKLTGSDNLDQLREAFDQGGFLERNAGEVGLRLSQLNDNDID